MASGFFSLVIYSYRKSRRSAKRAESFKETPWLARPEWANGVVKEGHGRGVIALWAIAVFWNGVPSPLLFVFRKEWESRNQAIHIALLLPLVGIGLLAAAIRSTLQWKRFGNLKRHLETLLRPIGGVFRARLLVPGVIVCDPAI
jgi:hypothetical protein